jgi:hypothetical protein
MEESAEQVASTHGARVILGADGRPGRRIWWSQPECPVGTVAVVMLDRDPEELLQVAAANDQQPVQALGADGPNPALGVGVGLWRPDWVTRMSASCDRNRSLKLRVNFASWSRSRKRTCRPRSSSTSSRLRACWVTQPPSGLAVTPPRWTRLLSSSTGEQHLPPPQPDGVDGEEVARHDPGGLLAQERSPGRSRPPWRGVEPVAAECRADRGR